MPTPSCRDALSREISAPVHDPFTGNCYRNPCAAEQVGVLRWVPGCVLGVPVYPNYDPPPDSWASEVWWDGNQDGGRGGRARHGGGGRRRRMPPPRGRRRTSPMGFNGSSGAIPRRVGGGSPLDPGSRLDRPMSRAGGDFASPSGAIRRGFDSMPMYASGPMPLMKSQSYQSFPGQNTARLSQSPMARSGNYTSTRSGGATRSSSMAPSFPSVGARRHTMTPRSTKAGMGQATTERTPLGQAIANIVQNWAKVAVLTVATPILIGGLVRWKTRSWGKALAAGAATVAVGGAALGGYMERHAAAPRTSTGIPTALFIR